MDPTPFLKILIELLKDLKEKKMSYDQAIELMEKDIQIIEKSLKESDKNNE